MGNGSSSPAITSVFTEENAEIGVASSSVNGVRDSNEDRVVAKKFGTGKIIISVIDGHTGTFCANTLQNQLSIALATAYTPIPPPIHPSSSADATTTTSIAASASANGLSSPQSVKASVSTKEIDKKDVNGGLVGRLIADAFMDDPIFVKSKMQTSQPDDTVKIRLLDQPLSDRIVRAVVNLDLKIIEEEDQLRDAQKPSTSAVDSHSTAATTVAAAAAATTVVKRVVYESGAVCVFAVVDMDKSTADIGNVGDSRALLIRRCADGFVIVQPLTESHSAQLEHERDRIVKTKTHFIGAQGRVDGMLMPTRSFGDAYFKRIKEIIPEQQAVTAVPDLIQVSLMPNDVLVLVCDGVTDVRSDIKIAQQCVRSLAKNASLGDVTEKLCLETVNDTRDNVTAVIYVHKPQQKSSVPPHKPITTKFTLGEWPRLLTYEIDAYERRYRADAALWKCDQLKLDEFIARQKQPPQPKTTQEESLFSTQELHSPDPEPDIIPETPPEQLIPAPDKVEKSVQTSAKTSIEKSVNKSVETSVEKAVGKSVMAVDKNVTVRRKRGQKRSRDLATDTNNSS